MAHTIHQKKPLLTRVRRIKGQISAIETALESEMECSQILQQIAAVRGAINGLMLHVLEGHVSDHLGKMDVSAEERQADVDQLNSILRSYLK